MKEKIFSFNSLVAIVMLASIISSCSFIKQLNRQPEGVFISNRISSYSIKRIALLPMIPDNEDTNGTYSATNYFLDLLVTEYPKLEFAEISDIRKHDFSFVPQALADIDKHKILDLQNFMNTDLGLLLKNWKCDAIIMGRVDSVFRNGKQVKTALLEKKILRINVSCYFSYYLVSLKDGHILWRSKEIGYDQTTPFGVSDNLDLRSENEAVSRMPINYALCNGIDQMSYKLPPEIFHKQF